MKDYSEQRKKMLRVLWTLAQKNGVTQVMIAERTGINQGHVSRFFAGDISPTIDMFLRVAEACKVKVKIKGSVKIVNLKRSGKDMT